jgi:hypothetical protein
MHRVLDGAVNAGQKLIGGNRPPALGRARAVHAPPEGFLAV